MFGVNRAAFFIFTTVVLDIIGLMIIFPIMPDILRLVGKLTISDAAVWGGRAAIMISDPLYLLMPWARAAQMGKLVGKGGIALAGLGAGVGVADATLRGLARDGEVSGKQVGFSACPNDAINEVINICDYVCKKTGGNGAVREFIDLDEAFSNLSNGLNTIVGNDGLNLSGGQKQLISIARALYKNSDIIVFDEANSALDFYYRDILKKTIQKLKGTKTIIFVTHDLSFLKNSFDEVYLIESGQISLR